MIHVKTEKEIELIRESCKIVHDTLEFVGSKIKAGMSTKEVDELVKVFEESGIECKSHIPDVVRSIVKNSVSLTSQKIRVKLVVDYLPTFGLSYNELKSIVIDIVKELYPNKRLYDNMGIEYFVE